MITKLTRRQNQQGFSLVELLIAMSVVVIIAAIAIPKYLTAVQRGHEAAAVNYLRQLQAAQEFYFQANKQYAETFAQLAPYLSGASSLREPGFVPTSGVAFALAPREAGQKDANTGISPGQAGTTPGQGGTPQGLGGTPPGHGGTPPGQAGKSPGSSSTSGANQSANDSMVNSQYIFTLTRVQPLAWYCVAEPIGSRTTSRFFYTDESNIIRYAVGTYANSSSPPL